MSVKKLVAVLKLTRIEHSLMLVIAVVAAELLASGSLPPLPILILSLIAPVFISMASFAINDYFDVEADRINKKMRPLVTGDLTRRGALYITVISLFIGVAASALINQYAFAITFIFGALAMLYSYSLKRMFVIGNAYIGLSMVIPYLFGNYVVSTSIGASIILVSVMTFISGFAREVQGTIRDYEGDVKARKVMTIPTVIGKKASALLALFLYVVAVLVSAYMFVYIMPFRYNLVFGIPVALSDVMLLYVGATYLSKNAERKYGMGRNVSLFAMGLALVAILLSAARAYI